MTLEFVQQRISEQLEYIDKLNNRKCRGDIDIKRYSELWNSAVSVLKRFILERAKLLNGLSE